MIISKDIFFKYIPKDLDNFVVGISGGADSLCLTLLLSEVTKNMEACFVNHKLRPESGDEIKPIIKILESRKINYKVLEWNHENITGNIELKARTARYELLYNRCKELNYKYLCVAHHNLDQWETFFMRLSKGSGLRGLGGILPISKYKDMKILRPLLNFSPDDLKETLKNRFNISTYVNDPMNDDIKYERVKWRKNYYKFSDMGLNTDNINRSINRLQTANDCLSEIAINKFNEIFNGERLNYLEFKKLHIELQMRILCHIIKKFFPNKEIVSYNLIERMAQYITSSDFKKSINFSGLLFKKKGKAVTVVLENRL